MLSPRDLRSQPVAVVDPVERDRTPLLRTVLPREVAGVKQRELAVRQTLVEVLGVRWRHERIALARDDLYRRTDLGKQVAQYLQVGGVTAHVARGLGEPRPGVR